MMANLYAAWAGILLGLIAGAIQGLFFHRDDWLGGYSSWPRRMTRLGHISLFGIAFINTTFALTTSYLKLEDTGALRMAQWCSWLFILGAVAMPLVCYLSAVRKWFRHLFFIPVTSLILGAALFVGGVLVK